MRFGATSKEQPQLERFEDKFPIQAQVGECLGVRPAESTEILQESGAGDGNRIVSQISKPRRNKVLPAAP
jgi:hypothetical protein